MKRSLALIAMTGALFAGCQQAPVGDDAPIKIGFIGPLTGDVSAFGTDLLHGVQMALEEVNAAGGIDGRHVELIAEDGRCTGSDAAAATQKLVNIDKVSVIVGGLCSGETLAAAPIAEAGKVVMLSPASSSPDITDAGDFIFRNYPSDAWRTQAMAKYLNESDLNAIAIVSENTDYSQALRASLIENVGEETVVFDEVFEPGNKDFRAILTRLNNEEFDALVSNANSDSLNALIVEQFRELGFDQIILGADTMDSANVAALGETANGVMIVNVGTAGEGEAFEQDFIAQYGDPQSSIGWAAYSFDATNILAQAMMSAGTDGSAIRDYLYSMPAYEGVVGSVSFDEQGDPIGIPYVLKEIQNGTITTIQDLPLK